MASERGTESATLREALERYDLSGFKVVGRDGDVGKVHETRPGGPGGEHVVVDTGPLFLGKKVALRPESVTRIDVERREIFADVDRDELRHGPEYDPERGLDEELHGRAGAERAREPVAAQPEGPDPEDRMRGAAPGLDQIRAEEPVANTVHNLVQTLSVKLDSSARYGLYQEDARKDGLEDCADLFRRLERLEREAIADLMHFLRKHVGGTTTGRSERFADRERERAF